MFLHREKELNILNNLLLNKNNKIAIYGKRRVGKTSLIKEIMKNKDNCIYFECVQDSLDINLELFVETLSKVISINKFIKFNNFIEVFEYLNSLDNKYNIFIDEYPYLKKQNNNDSVDSLFQKIFDNYSSNLNIILCGSEIKMMSELLVEGNPIFGRFNKVILLKEMNYIEASSFYDNKSIMDKIAFYSVFGGSPYINTFIDKNKSLKDNIIELFLNEQSPVYSYANYLLISDAVNQIQAKKIVSIIKNGKKRFSEIENIADPSKTGKIIKSLKSLTDLDLIKKVYPINRLNDSKKAYYELNDNAMRFFYTYVYNAQSLIVTLGANAYYDAYIKDSLTTFISHRFEEIVRDYYSILSQNNKLDGIRNIGTFYYDDSSTKSNGEFDVALEFKDYIKLIEVKYYKDKLKKVEMDKEAEQLNKIKTSINIKQAFVSTSGYEESDYECIDINDLYKCL